MRLIIDNLSFNYGSIKALEGVTFEVQDSEIIGIIGPNGSGKSTLLKCINRILKPKQGYILFNDLEINSMKRIEIAKIFGYVPQEGDMNYDDLTVFEIVLMGRRPYIRWWCEEEDLEKVWQILSLLNIENLAMRKINEISGGERQKVLIARALAQEAKILLLDEPTSNLDIKHQLEVMNLIRKLTKEKNIATIIALHDLNLASMYCDKLIMMKEGKIFAAGKPDYVLTVHNIEEVYGIKVIIERRSNRPYIVLLEDLNKEVINLVSY